MQILQSRQGNLEEGKGTSCWRRYLLETKAQSGDFSWHHARRSQGSSEVHPVLRYPSTLPNPPTLSHSSLKNVNIPLDPEPQSTAPCLPSGRCCSPKALGQGRAATSRAAPSGVGAAPGLRRPQLPSGSRPRPPGPTGVGAPAGTALLAGRSLLMRLQLIKI